MQLLTLKQPWPEWNGFTRKQFKMKYSLSYGKDIQRISMKKNTHRIN